MGSNSRGSGPGGRLRQEIGEFGTSSSCRFKGPGAQCELDRIAAQVKLAEDVWEQAVPICCAMVEQRLARGRDIRTVAASSIYAACRESRVAITLKELATASHVSPRELGRTYMLILDKMGIRPPSPNGSSYIAKIAAKIHASEEVTKLSREVEKRAVEAGLGGRNPMSLAAAALYTASLAKGEPITQTDLAEAAGVSVISLRETAKCMRSLCQVR